MAVSPNHLFLYGPPASGKSTVGRILAERLGRPFVDLDAQISAHERKAIPQIFSEVGELGFRQLEHNALRDAAAAVVPSVISLGGGALLRPENRALAETSGEIVFLDADAAILAKRASRRPGSRPLVGKAKPIDVLLAERAEHYASFPCRVKVLDVPAAKMTDWVQNALGWFRVTGMGEPYEVRVGDGFLSKLGNLAAALDAGDKTVVVGDDHTVPLYGRAAVESLAAAGIAATLFTIPSGEETKTIRTVETIWNAFLKAGIERRHLVVALGGGVVGDLTGFAAATWLRGVRWINVPTSLLAMVDSGIGGKTGADLDSGKNLIGAFHPPVLVLADTSALASLPEREVHNGLAEAIKHAVIGDPGLIACLQPGGKVTADFVKRAMAVKIRVIERDPFEKGIRAALNLGHTIGHAIEKLTHFKVSHGEGVAIGTVQEARLAEKAGLAAPGFADGLAAVFKAAGLPTELPGGIAFPELKAALAVDKKKADGQVRFALPAALGDVRVGQLVDDAALQSLFQ